MSSAQRVLDLVAAGASGWAVRGLSGPTSARLRDCCAEHGWRFLLTDVSSVGDKKALLNLLAESWQLPDYFGHNWDALADCLADIDHGTSGTVLRLKGLGAMPAALAQTFTDVLTERVQLSDESDVPAFVVVTDPPLPGGVKEANPAPALPGPPSP